MKERSKSHRQEKIKRRIAWPVSAASSTFSNHQVQSVSGQIETRNLAHLVPLPSLDDVKMTLKLNTYSKCAT